MKWPTSHGHLAHVPTVTPYSLVPSAWGFSSSPVPSSVFISAGTLSFMKPFDRFSPSIQLYTPPPPFVFWVFVGFFFSFLVVLHLRCCTWAFSSCGERGLLSSLGAQTTRCSDFSHCRTQDLGTQTSAAAAHQPHCSSACGILLHQGSNPCPLHPPSGFPYTVSPEKSHSHLVNSHCILFITYNKTIGGFWKLVILWKC